MRIPAMAGLLWALVSPVGCASTSVDSTAAYDEFEQTLRLYYAYIDREDFDVEALLERGRESVRGIEDSEEFLRALRAVTIAFTDPHLDVRPLESSDPNVGPTSADLAIAYESNRYVVVDVRADSPADSAGVRPGWEVLQLGGASIASHVSEILKLVHEPTDRQRGYAATKAANGRRDNSPRSIRFSVNGVPTEMIVDNPRPFAVSVSERAPVEVGELAGVCSIRFNNSLGRDETIAAFDAAIEAVQSCPALVIDLRNTPSGGNTTIARSIIGHFVREPRPYQTHEIPAIERKTTVPRRFVEYVVPREPHYGGQLAVLGGRWTGSMGEGTVIGLHAAANATTIASDMGDLLGALHIVDLPLAGGSLEVGAEALSHVNGTPRGEYTADIPLPSSDRTPAGTDPTEPAIRNWLAAE